MWLQINMLCAFSLFRCRRVNPGLAQRLQFMPGWMHEKLF